LAAAKISAFFLLFQICDYFNLTLDVQRQLLGSHTDTRRTADNLRRLKQLCHLPDGTLPCPDKYKPSPAIQPCENGLTATGVFLYESF